MKILVAGAGIAGSVLTHMLRERGHEVTLIDPWPRRSASHCAYAYLRTAWFKGADKHRVRESLAWYERRGDIVTRTGSVTTGRSEDDTLKVRNQSDHVLVHPSRPLLVPDILWGVTRYREVPGGVLVDTTEGLPLDAQHLVLACGAGMDRWYTGSPVYGGVYECKSYRMITPLKLLRVTDRLTHVAADDGAVTRTAASKGRTPEEARARADKILELMMDRGMIACTRRWTYRAGVRWQSIDRAPVADRISEHVWALTGFARNGYAMAPSYANDLVTKLEAA